MRSSRYAPGGLGAGVVPPPGAGFAFLLPWRSTWLAVAHSPMMVALPLKRLWTRASRLLRMPMPVLMSSSGASALALPKASVLLKQVVRASSRLFMVI